MKSTRRRLIPSIIVFLIGMALTIIGALFKIQHWSYAPELLTFGSLIEVLGIFFVIITLIKVYNNKT